MCLLLAFAVMACEPNNTEDPTPGGEGNQTEQPEEKPTPEPTPEPEPIPLPNISREVPACSIAEFTNWQTKIMDKTLGDFSGVCFNLDKSGLIGVENYRGSLYNISFDGVRDETYFAITGKDMEGVTLDYDNNVIYMAEEGGNFIWKSAYKDGAYAAPSRLKWIETHGTESNGGLEGITYHDGYLYVANQSPAELLIYSIEHNGVAHSYMANFITECFSDLWFDTTNNTLWAVDAWSSKKEIVNFTVWGDLIARFSSPIPWPEGICLDFENNKAWFACDSTGQLYSADIVRNTAE